MELVTGRILLQVGPGLDYAKKASGVRESLATVVGVISSRSPPASGPNGLTGTMRVERETMNLTQYSKTNVVLKNMRFCLFLEDLCMEMLYLYQTMY